MTTPTRIRNADAYRDSQPDLDVYNPCFAGYASPRFCGSDLDGLFVAGMVVNGGFWEHTGYLLFLEHKAATTAWSLGQWIALNALAAYGRRDHRLIVVVTYGMPDAPSAYHRLPLSGWKRGITASDHPPRPMSMDDIETVPMRRWIRWVAERTQLPF